MRKTFNAVEMFPSIQTENVVTFTCRGYNCAVRFNDSGRYWEANIPELDDGAPRWYGKHRDAKLAELWVRQTLKCDTLPEMTPRTRTPEEVERVNRRAEREFIDTVSIDPMPRTSRRTSNPVQTFDIHEMIERNLFGKTGS